MIALTILAASLLGFQKPGQTLVGVSIVRGTGKNATAVLFPIATCKDGIYKTAEDSQDTKKPESVLSLGTTFQLYRAGRDVGSIKVKKLTASKLPTVYTRVGEGDLHLDPSMYPKNPATHQHAEDVVVGGLYDMSDKHTPSRAFMALNAKRAKPRDFVALTPTEEKAIEKLILPVVKPIAAKRKITVAKLGFQELTAFDINGDGRLEYAALLVGPNTDPNSELGENSPIFVIGDVVASKFKTLYLESTGNSYPTPFDLLDIDADGVPEVICSQYGYEANGFCILSWTGTKFKLVFDEMEFGV